MKIRKEVFINKIKNSTLFKAFLEGKKEKPRREGEGGSGEVRRKIKKGEWKMKNLTTQGILCLFHINGIIWTWIMNDDRLSLFQ